MICRQMHAHMKLTTQYPAVINSSDSGKYLVEVQQFPLPLLQMIHLNLIQTSYPEFLVKCLQLL